MKKSKISKKYINIRTAVVTSGVVFMFLGGSLFLVSLLEGTLLSITTYVSILIILFGVLLFFFVANRIISIGSADGQSAVLFNKRKHLSIVSIQDIISVAVSPRNPKSVDDYGYPETSLDSLPFLYGLGGRLIIEYLGLEAEKALPSQPVLIVQTDAKQRFHVPLKKIQNIDTFIHSLAVNGPQIIFHKTIVEHLPQPNETQILLTEDRISDDSQLL